MMPIARAALAGALLSTLACGGAGGSAKAPAPAALSAPVASTSLPAPAAPPAASSEEDAAVPISTTNPSWGNRTALVTIVEFADFECPFCGRAEATLARVRETYGADIVRVVWKNRPLPFHPNAQGAAEAAAGVFAMGGNAAFWRFHDTALREQTALGLQAYESWARDGGVADAGAFAQGLAVHRWAGAVDKDLREAKDLSVFGTPTFFVNGLPLAGALPFPTFQGIIDSQVKAAEAKIAGGLARERLYAELARDNRAQLAADQGDDEDAADSKSVYKVPIGKSPARGSPTALVTLIEFADYQCPFCVRVEPTIKELRDEYGDKLRVVFKDLPLAFHEHAEAAAEAALEVRAERGDAAFWSMHDELLASAADLDDASLVKLGGRFGARPDAVKAAIANHTHHKSIDEDFDLADDIEANGTPHFFINGRRLVGTQPKEKFEAIIEEEIHKSQGLLDAGTKPERLYDELVRDGKGAAPPEKKPLPTPLPARDPVRGNLDAPVTLHEWSDFQCPFCKRAVPTIERVIREYGPKVKLVWHDLPLAMHADAPLAARAAREALAQKGQPGFWAMHDRIFDHQPQMKRSELDGYARGLGLDMTKWNAALDGDAHQGEVDADKDAADGMSINGTPAFVIVPKGAQAGYFVGGAQPYAKFRKLIDRALAEAK
jgi:protein-disulfide isomerase